jgi:hypothetical protein
MKFKIPFTVSDIEILKRRSKNFTRYVKHKKTKTKLDNYLEDSGGKIDRLQYLAICYRGFLLNILFFSILGTAILFFLNSNIFISTE